MTVNPPLSKANGPRHRESCNWIRMGETTLVGAARMAWQSHSERAVDVSLFGKVTGFPDMSTLKYKNRITWATAILLGLSIEQCLKALIMETTNLDRKDWKTHCLLRLWDKLSTEEHQGITHEIIELGKRTWGTRFGDFPTPVKVEEVREIISCHNDVFVNARYYGEPDKKDLTRNGELWKIALGTYVYAKTLIRIHS